jgi:copper transport outer membrane protein MctB
MLDFRYHALSIVAVFLALGIGIVLGATLGDSVVSQANKDVRSSLRGDLVAARASVRTAAGQLADRDRFATDAFAYIAGGKLRGRRVAIVSSGPLPQDVESSARNAVKDAGGTVDSRSQFDARPDRAALGQKLGHRFQALGTDRSLIRRLGRRVGKALVTGGRLPRRLENGFPDSFTGDYRGAEAVVYYRTNDDRDNDSKTFESALIEGMRSSGAPVVGVERTETDPSQIPAYVSAGLSTVDDIEIPPGRIALVLTLTGRRGDFGFKKTAEAPIPPAPGG